MNKTQFLKSKHQTREVNMHSILIFLKGKQERRKECNLNTSQSFHILVFFLVGFVLLDL